MSKTKRIIAAVTAAIITATSTSLMSVFADNGEVKKADSITATKADNTKSSLQEYADDISTYMMVNSIAGDAFVHDNKVVVTYSAHEDKIKAYIMEKGIDESIVVYEKGHNVGAIIDDKTDAEKPNEENTTDKDGILQEYADDISTYMMENSIAGDAFVHDNKIVVTYSAHEDKIKAYIMEKGIDENLVVYEKGRNQEDITDDEKEAALKEYAADISNFMIKSDIAGDAFVHDGKVVVTFSAYEDKIKAYVKEKGIDENIVVYEKGQDQNTKGDANCDGQVDLSDAVMIMQALANPNKYGIDGTAEHHLTEQGKLNGDMNGDGLTSGDALTIQKMLLGLSFKDEEQSDIVESVSKINIKYSAYGNDNEIPIIKLHTSDLPNETIYTVLKNNESIKSSYDPALNSALGIGMLFEIEFPQNTITLSTKEGSFKAWKMENGIKIIDSVGQTYKISDSGSVFWVPDELDNPDGFECEIVLHGDDNGKAIELGRIIITQTNDYNAVLK